ncbi:unnamed protein product [Zymoseptoria tritici ST99CH_3D1]|nr:unnamed protein product [Zymoseptoria tritici ST99CH_3D1]
MSDPSFRIMFISIMETAIGVPSGRRERHKSPCYSKPPASRNTHAISPDVQELEIHPPESPALALPSASDGDDDPKVPVICPSQTSKDGQRTAAGE